eukprot:TRINITY_DN71540_c0_g1_i1.p1 TRINITY_DN71540_c0_g1~~TRINITY_DN71540_c0_g1_i1.p1  ORF type:complete len:290 (+),score=53.43 TRINITY_DN71540_c0_g1_i1:45-872(+)
MVSFAFLGDSNVARNNTMLFTSMEKALGTGRNFGKSEATASVCSGKAFTASPQYEEAISCKVAIKIVMLGTNDCQTGYHASASRGVCWLCNRMKESCSRIVIVSPPGDKGGTFGATIRNVRRQLKELAERIGADFVELPVALGYAPDKIHLSARGGKQLAAAIQAVLNTRKPARVTSTSKATAKSKAKAKAKAQAKRPATAEAKARFRSGYAKDKKVTFVQSNPKVRMRGSEAWARYESYKRSKTIGEAEDNGQTSRDRRYDLARGYMKVQLVVG